MWDYLRLSVRGIRRKGVRSWLTMLGIFIGIAAVVSLISLGKGMENAIMAQFESIGSDTIIVMPGTGFESFGSAKLTAHDEDIIRGIAGVENLAPFSVRLSRVEYGRDVFYGFVGGWPTDDRYEVIDSMSTFKLLEGRRSQPGEKYTTVVGYSLGEGGFINGRNVRIGDKLTIDGVDFKVVGVMDRVGNPEDDKNIYIPLDAAEEIFGDDTYDQFIVKVAVGYPPEKIAGDIKYRMRRDRNQKAGEEDFSVQTPEQLLESVGGILTTVQAVLVGIAMISLMVGGVGIMNTMYTSVIERTREIGIMKAIGAKNDDILAMFLAESGTLGAVGGLVGIAIGLAMSKTVEYYGGAQMGNDLLKADTSPALILGALAFSFVVGCLSGTLPAMQASRLKPVEALRYE